MAFQVSNHAVEVNGIYFETLIPENLLPILKPNSYLCATSISGQIGIRITNRTESSHRFQLFNLTPELLSLDGCLVHGDSGRNRTYLIEKSDFSLALPGESLFLLLDYQLFQYEDGLQLSIWGKDGTVWSFSELQPGAYQIRLRYRNESSVGKIYIGSGVFETLFEDVWIGVVTTSGQRFNLIML